MRIGDQNFKELQEKDIPLVKVLWSQQEENNATCELESNMREVYSHLFTTK